MPDDNAQVLAELEGWLADELTQPVAVLSYPDRQGDQSRLEAVRTLQHQLDAEMQVGLSKLGIEHTKFLSVDDQIRRKKTGYDILKASIQSLCLPPGHGARIEIDHDTLGGLSRADMAELVPRFRSEVQTAVATLLNRVSSEVSGCAGPVRFTAFLCPGLNRLLVLGAVDPDIEEAMSSAIAKKALKRATYDYRQHKWRTLLLLERVPYNVRAPWDDVPLAIEVLAMPDYEDLWHSCVLGDRTTGTFDFFWVKRGGLKAV